MRLTTYTDYGLRVLMYVALKEGELATIQEIADAYAHLQEPSDEGGL